MDSEWAVPLVKAPSILFIVGDYQRNGRESDAVTPRHYAQLLSYQINVRPLAEIDCVLTILARS